MYATCHGVNSGPSIDDCQGHPKEMTTRTEKSSNMTWLQPALECRRKRLSPLPMAVLLVTTLGLPLTTIKVSAEGNDDSFDNVAPEPSKAEVRVKAVNKLASIFAMEVESAARLTLEGQVLYENDDVKLRAGQYCSNSVKLADQGEFRKAIREASKALFLGESKGNPYLLGLAERDLAQAYSFAGQLDRAECLPRPGGA